MISACGLIETADLDEVTVWQRIQRSYDRGYRRRDAGGRWRDGLDFAFDPQRPEDIPVDFIGVWDTVGALGIPEYLGWLNMFDPLHRYSFHNVTLNPHIRHGRHAVAMDERRRPYMPALWSEPYASGQDVKQVWFPGSHKDVGGGHLRMGLSDGALLWMIEEAREAVGLGFNPATVEQAQADPLDVLHEDDLIGGVLQPLIEPTIRPWLEIFLHPQPRAVPKIDPDAPNPSVHTSVYERHLAPPITSGHYRSTHVLAPGESATVDTFAHRPWNDTGLYLDPGDYLFAADGEWRAGNITSGPAGTTGLNRFNPLTERTRLVGTVVGQIEALFKRVTGNTAADFLGSPREADLPWMSLVGVVANNASTANGTRTAHERIAIGANTQHRVNQGGYLYAFANDAWGQYASNQGSVRLVVTRVVARKYAARRGKRAAPVAAGRGRRHRQTV